MKKYITIIITGLTFSALQAQETTPEDALRYAVENLTGSARFRGMSGAFGAVGGDLSSINQNPAGSIFFNNNYATVTAASYNSKNISRYYGTTTKDNDSSLDLNQAGVAFVFVDNNPKNDWKKFTLAFNYENNNNFNNNLYSAGINPYNSIDKYFLRFANGTPQEGGILLTTLINGDYGNMTYIDQQAVLGYNAYIFDPLDADSPQNSVYTSNVPTADNYFHSNYLNSNGYDGKFSANFATAYKNRLFLGINLNYHYTDNIRNSSILEAYDTDPNTGLQSVEFATETHTFGNGFSFDLGAIVKATESLRLGIAYQSPTWYRLKDEQRQAVRTYCPDCDPDGYNPIIFDPGITMISQPYTIQTPGKWTGSAAYMFGKKGLLSADVIMKDYGSTKFTPENNDLNRLNYFNNAILDRAIEVRLGGEYKYKQMSFRGGYRFDQSPYKVDQTFGDLTGYSGGLGYTFGDSKIDVAYSYDHRNFNYTFLPSGMTDPARVSRYNNNITISYSVNF